MGGQDAGEADQPEDEAATFDLPPGIERDIIDINRDQVALVGRSIIKVLPYLHCTWGSTVVTWEGSDLGLDVYEAWCGTPVGSLHLGGECVGLASFADGLLLAWTSEGHILFAEAGGPVRGTLTVLPARCAPDLILEADDESVLARVGEQWWSYLLGDHGTKDWEAWSLLPDQRHAVRLRDTARNQESSWQGGLLAALEKGSTKAVTLLLPPPHQNAPLQWVAPQSLSSVRVGPSGLYVGTGQGVQEQLALYRGDQTYAKLWTQALSWVDPLRDPSGNQLPRDARALYAGALALHAGRELSPAGTGPTWRAALDHWRVAASCPEGMQLDACLAKRLWDNALRHGPIQDGLGSRDVRLLARLATVLRREWLREQALACVRMAATVLDGIVDRDEAWFSAADELAQILRPLDPAESARIASAFVRDGL